MSTLIDCDIHSTIASLKTLYPYLPDHWQDYLSESAFTGPDMADYATGSRLSAAPDTRPENGPPGSSFEHVRTHTLDAHGLTFGILTCNYWVQSVHHEDLAAALAQAINDWQVEHWLEPEPRFRASLVAPTQNPELAECEIERIGRHPGFVQIIVPVRSDMPYGKRHFDPVYRAAVKHDLSIGIHYGGSAGHPSTPAGWPITFLEEYAGMSQLFQSQVMSLITDGAFDRFPDLRVTLIESGFSWLPSLMWRIDKEWKGLRHEIPWVKRPPSDYMRRHIRLTTAPADLPDRPEHITQLFEQMGSEELLLHASDYPHWHGNERSDAWIEKLPKT
ncbi:MAG: amidohydrolase, partial [candidate division Zixibacteria bacterium]|nr:amidohydrolase [candidate division Zixibacteria bacterium]